MAKTKLNILPLPTFGQLGVNYAERETAEITSEPITMMSRGKSDAPMLMEIHDSTALNLAVSADSSVFLIQHIKANERARVAAAISAGEGAEVRLVQIFEGDAPVAAQLDTRLLEGARLELVQLYIGGSDTVSEITTHLLGRKSAFETAIGYTLDGEQKLDVNLIADHKGKKSTSQIAVSGVLSDCAQKTFKGTIDFKNGAAGAKGSEQEEVLLMSEDVRNRTVPVILCAEEDVEGNHGATIGRIDERHIFYMKSRGIPEEKIYELMARSKLMQVIKKIGDKETESRVYKALGWGDDDE